MCWVVGGGSLARMEVYIMNYKERLETLASYGARLRAQFAPESGFMLRLGTRMHKARREQRASERRLGIFRPFDAVGFAVMWGYRMVLQPGHDMKLYGFIFSALFLGFHFEEHYDISPPAAQE